MLTSVSFWTVKADIKTRMLKKIMLSGTLKMAVLNNNKNSFNQ